MQPNHLVLIMLAWLWIVLPHLNGVKIIDVADLNLEKVHRRTDEKEAGPSSAKKAPSTGDVCVTPHGSCDMSKAAVIGSDCRCFIPGYGSKQGQVGR